MLPELERSYSRGMDRTKAVMVRFTPEEYARVVQAHTSASTLYSMPLAAWLRRTLLNLAPPVAPPAKTRPRSRKRAA